MRNLRYSIASARDALVADFRLTRTANTVRPNLKTTIHVIDTGGITGDEEGIDAAMAEQSLLAIDEADVVFVDARAEPAADQLIADHLRRQDKTVQVVANEVDGIDGDGESAEFYAMGLGTIAQIAAAHGRGVSRLLDNALLPLDEAFPDMQIQEETIDADEDTEAQLQRLQLPIKLAIVGKPNVVNPP